MKVKNFDKWVLHELSERDKLHENQFFFAFTIQ